MQRNGNRWALNLWTVNNEHRIMSMNEPTIEGKSGYDSESLRCMKVSTTIIFWTFIEWNTTMTIHWGRMLGYDLRIRTLRKSTTMFMNDIFIASYISNNKNYNLFIERIKFDQFLSNITLDRPQYLNLLLQKRYILVSISSRKTR